MVVIGQKLFVFGQSYCNRAKLVVCGQSGLYFGRSSFIVATMIVLGYSGYIRAKGYVFGQKWLYSYKMVVIG